MPTEWAVIRLVPVNKSSQDTSTRRDPREPNQAGYESYRSQVDPEELFRKIFGEAFSRGGFANHDWMNEPDENKFGRQGITQVSSAPLHRSMSTDASI